ncbi:MAG: OsmC family protein [Gemmatimonadaceae bacterium]
MITRKADARWEGELKTGKGTIKLGSGAYEGPYSFGTRFESAPGTNPEELIGAAHAGCFSMDLNNRLATSGHLPTSVATTAEVRLDRVDGKMTIVGIALTCVAKVPGLDAAEFQKVAEEAKAGCIISRALASVPMTLKATLG